VTLPPLSHEQHARLREAKRYLNQGLASFDEPVAADSRGFLTLCMSGALTALKGMESGPGRASSRTDESAPPTLVPVPPAGGSPSTDYDGPEAA
jgi:hypothetical protein